MAEHDPYPDENEELIRMRMIVGDKQAIAYAWIEAYVENLNEMISGERDPDDEDDPYSGGDLTADEVIDIALENLAGGWGYISRGGTFEGYQLDPTFWDKLADLKGIEIPSHDRNSFFSCSC